MPLGTPENVPSRRRALPQREGTLIILSVLTQKSARPPGTRFMTGGVTTRTSQNAARASGCDDGAGGSHGEKASESRLDPLLGPHRRRRLPLRRLSRREEVVHGALRPRRDSPARLTRCSVPPARGASPRGARIPRVPASAPSAKEARWGPGRGRRSVRATSETREGRRRRRRRGEDGEPRGWRRRRTAEAEATATREGARDARPVPSAARGERARIRRGAGTGA